MTSVMLASRLTRNLSIKGATNLAADAATMLLDAMNSGIREWFSLAPLERRRSTESEAVKAPVPITVDILDGAKGFVYAAPTANFPIGGYATEDLLIGKSLLIGGDAKINMLNRHGELRYPYLGNGGVQTGSVFCDTIPFAQNDAKILGLPKWTAQSGETNYLTYQSNTEWWDDHWSCAPVTGIPQFFTTEAHNPLDCDRTYWLLRVWPIPVIRGMISYKIEHFPSALVFDDLQIPKRIPIPEAEIADAIYLCEEHLISTPIWSKDANVGQVRNQADRTRVKLNNMSSTHNNSAGRIGTKFNF